MSSQIIKKLIDFGLSDKEAKIYLALLQLQTATANEAAKHAGINRSTAYVVIESLKDKGLLAISDEKKVRKYVASSPELLFHLAKTSAKKHEEIKAGIESIVPELKALHRDTRHKPVIKVYEGENAARDVYWDLFSSKTKELRTYANPMNIFRHIPDFQEHDKERGRRGIKMFAINPASKEIAEFFKRGPKPHEPYEIALIPEDKFKFSSDLGIFGDKVTLVSPKDNFGIVIENREIADMLRNSFDLSWAEAKRLDKNLRKKLE